MESEGGAVERSVGRTGSFLFLLGFLFLGATTAVDVPLGLGTDESLHWWVGLFRSEKLVGQDHCGMAQELPFLREDGRMVGIAKRLTAARPRCWPVDVAHGTVLTYPTVLLAKQLNRGADRDVRRALHLFFFARLTMGLLVGLAFWRVIQAWTRRGGGLPGLLTAGALLWSPVLLQQSFTIGPSSVGLLAVLLGLALCLGGERASWIDLAGFAGAAAVAVLTDPAILPLCLAPAVWVMLTHTRMREHPIALATLVASLVVPLAAGGLAILVDGAVVRPDHGAWPEGVAGVLGRDEGVPADGYHSLWSTIVLVCLALDGAVAIFGLAGHPGQTLRRLGLAVALGGLVVAGALLASWPAAPQLDGWRMAFPVAPLLLVPACLAAIGAGGERALPNPFLERAARAFLAAGAVALALALCMLFAHLHRLYFGSFW